ncbi:hypothetical protein [Gallaecimonas sp. GXIMD4217]|uniref:hypothetical protein n=1 Tax=Gallaecimonas sp. GXIMD4217 TaxID=3131927 RepID=UPI00311B2A7E
MNRFTIAAMLVALVGCTTVDRDFRVDGSTAQSTEAGIATISKGLSRKERFALQMALLRIQLADVKSGYQFLADKSLHSTNYELVGPRINGLTYPEILALSKRSAVKVTAEP